MFALDSDSRREPVEELMDWQVEATRRSTSKGCAGVDTFRGLLREFLLRFFLGGSVFGFSKSLRSSTAAILVLFAEAEPGILTERRPSGDNGPPGLAALGEGNPGPVPKRCQHTSEVGMEAKQSIPSLFNSSLPVDVPCWTLTATGSGLQCSSIGLNPTSSDDIF